MSRAPAEVLAALGAPRVVVVGDLMLDRYVTGRRRAHQPRGADPGAARRVATSERLGGAGSRRARPRACSARAAVARRRRRRDDAAARALRALARGAGIDARAPSRTRRGRRASRRATSRAATRARSRCCASTARTRGAARRRRRGGACSRALDARARGRRRACCVSDYAKGAAHARACSRALIAWGAKRGHARRRRPEGRATSRATAARPCITPNRARGARRRPGVADHGRSPDAERAAARAPRSDSGSRFVLVTLDRDGMYLKDGDGRGAPRPAPTPREVFDVTGAGDMVLAVLGARRSRAGAHARARPRRSPTSPRASRSSSVGVVPITRDEIAARLAERGAAAAAKVVRRAPTAGGARRAPARRGPPRRLHERLLRRAPRGPRRATSRYARAHGDVLVVGPQRRRERAAAEGRRASREPRRRTAPRCSRRSRPWTTWSCSTRTRPRRSSARSRPTCS